MSTAEPFLAEMAMAGVTFKKCVYHTNRYTFRQVQAWVGDMWIASAQRAMGETRIQAWRDSSKKVQGFSTQRMAMRLRMHFDDVYAAASE